MPRKQVNLSFTDLAYELVKTAADAQGLTINQFARATIMDAAEPIPEDLEEDGGFLPMWLLGLLALLRRTPRSLAGKPMAGFHATPSRRIIVLCGMTVSVIRFKNPLLHRQSSLRKRRLGENRGFRPSF